MSPVTAVLSVLVVAGCTPPQIAPEPLNAPPATASAVPSSSPLPSEGSVVVFEGMCDASGAIPIDEHTFAVADDEDNLIRIYDANRGGPPLSITPIRGIEGEGGELDLEGATRVGEYGLWISSHGRTRNGARVATRINLFLSTAPAQGAPLSVIGKPYQALLTALGADAALERYHLARAAEIAPTLAGGLNIEGLTARNDGGVIIGFRSPVPDGRALLVGLKNPVEVARTEAMPIFDAVHQLDLGEGRGVRGLSAWHGRYLVIGGSPTHTTVSQLYTWDGVSPTARPIAVDLGAYNPEAFFTPEARDAFMLLSDDGHVERAGTLCKRLPNPASKSFRGLWLSLPDGHGPR